MRQEKKPTPPVLLLISCAFLFVSGFFVVRFPDIEGASYATYAFNALIAAPAFLALLKQLGMRRGLLIIGAVSVFGYLIEGIGVATGLPYGEFYYRHPMGPRVADLVPYLLPLSYVPLVISSVTLALSLTVAGRRGQESRNRGADITGSVAVKGPSISAGQRGKTIVLGGLFLVIIDGVLDPAAVFLSFWVYPGGGPYYGVPLSNYVGWAISGILAATIVTSLGDRQLLHKLRPGLLDSLLISMFLWLGVSISSGLTIPAVLAVAIIIFTFNRRLALARRF